jgi:hypothetical protein
MIMEDLVARTSPVDVDSMTSLTTKLTGGTED